MAHKKMPQSDNTTSQGGLRRKTGVAQACTVCYQKKIRCDLSTGKVSCTTCSLYSTDCRPRMRKRKRGLRSLPSETRNPSTSQPLDGDTPMSREPGQNSSTQIPRQPEAFAQRLTPEGRDDLESLPSVTAYRQSRPRTDGPDVHYPPNDEKDETSPTSNVHDGRAIYFESIEGRDVESTKAYPPTVGTSPSDVAALEASQAFGLPPRAVKTCYVDNFFKYCYPWVPIVERSWLHETPGQKPSILLLQAVLLAGSRVTRPNNIKASRELYTRAKTLFFSNREQNHVFLIIASLLLQWWNPVGPDRVCMDSSQFWLRTGVGIAMSIGLHKTDNTNSRDSAFRRRLWWCLVARDSQVSAAHGRPRAIQMEESNVPLLTRREIPADIQKQNIASISFFAICRIFGDIGESFRRSQMTATRIAQTRNNLYAWLRELPPELRLFHPQADLGLNPYSFDARRIHIIYFVNLILLLRGSPSRRSGGSLLAASFIAAIFEEFLIRDEIGYLGPGIYKFFLLTAGIILLPAHRSSPSRLQSNASEDYDIIKRSLGQFSHRYPSALATLHTLKTLETTQVRASEPYEHLQSLDPEFVALFWEFGPGLCRQWDLLTGSENGYPDTVDTSERQSSEMRQRETASSYSSITGVMALNPQDAASENFPFPGELFGMDNTGGTEELDSLWPLAWSEMPDPTSWILKDTPFDFGD